MNKIELGPKGAIELADAMENNTSLSILDLSYNAIGAHGATCLVASIQKNVKELHMENCSIGNEGMIAVCKRLPTMQLTHLK